MRCGQKATRFFQSTLNSVIADLKVMRVTNSKRDITAPDQLPVTRLSDRETSGPSDSGCIDVPREDKAALYVRSVPKKGIDLQHQLESLGQSEGLLSREFLRKYGHALAERAALVSRTGGNMRRSNYDLLGPNEPNDPNDTLPVKLPDGPFPFRGLTMPSTESLLSSLEKGKYPSVDSMRMLLAKLHAVNIETFELSKLDRGDLGLYTVIGTSLSLAHTSTISKQLSRVLQSVEVPNSIPSMATSKNPKHHGGWSMLRFGPYIVHIMTNSVRKTINLESIYTAPVASDGDSKLQEYCDQICLE